ncbi:hypothetical protein [Candidatus Absconditicoccus praedator]|uniref:hypothetical protein n=1 Tax=Candidatus Absconditicoccus praedator TaxID=2735562 RepID=UPI001E59E0E9|nr:hypothetical protein [Candidatus Absconditicoccus praedator]UFX83057.1 hypothetical protein HLG78_02885 [Candidatus Absconditicoccus praedator]
MKKIVVLFLLVFLGNFVSAGFQDEATELENNLIDDLEMSADKTLSGYDSQVDAFKDDKQFEILDEYGYLKFDEKRSDYLNDLFDLEDDIVDDFSDLRSEKRSIERQLNRGMIDEDDYNDEKEDLQDYKEYLKDRYQEKILNFSKEGVDLVESLDGIYEDTKKENEDLINMIKNNIESFEELLNKYEDFEDTISKVNDMYVGANADIHTFIKTVEERTSDNLESSLDRLANDYYSRYSNLEPNAGDDINDQIDSIIVRYKSRLNDYFEEIIEAFYSEADYENIKDEFLSLESDIFDNGKYNYKNIEKLDLDKVDDIIADISYLKEDIDKSLEKFDEPEDDDDLRESMISKAENFYNSQLDENKKSLERFVEREKELIGVESSRELRFYNDIEEKIESMKSMSVSDRVDKKKSIIDEIEEKIDGSMVDKQLQESLKEKRWELYIDRIDDIIRRDGMLRFTAQYRGIDDTLLTILENISEEDDNFEDRLKDAIESARYILSSEDITDHHRFVIKKIKQSMLRYLYT